MTNERAAAPGGAFQPGAHVPTRGDRPAVIMGDGAVVTYAELDERSKRYAEVLRSAGLRPGDHVAILSENRPEWTMGDFAILAANAVTVPIYPTLLGWQIEYILNDSGAVAVICSTEEQLMKLREIIDHCPSVHNIIICDPPPTLPEKTRTFQSVVAEGAQCEASEGRARFDELLKARPHWRRPALDLGSGPRGHADTHEAGLGTLLKGGRR